MKKVLGISLVAVLAVSPLMARAEVTYPVDPAAYKIASTEANQAATNETDTPEAAGDKYFKGKQVVATDAQRVATGAYVKGAYNAAISAINKVAKETSTSAGAGIDKTNGKFSVDVTKDSNENNISGLQFTGSGDNATLDVKAGNGIKVDANGVAVNYDTQRGLGLDASGKLGVRVEGPLDYQVDGAINLFMEDNAGLGVGTNNRLEIKTGDGLTKANNEVKVNLTENKGLQIDATNKTLEIKDGDGIKTGANGVEVDLTTNGGLEIDENHQLKTKVDGTTIEIDAATGALKANLGDYATKTGVVNTVKSGYVQTVTDAVLTDAGVTALTEWGDDDATTTMGKASLVVTRGNVNVQLPTTGEGANATQYQTTAVTATPAVQTKTTPVAANQTADWTPNL